MSEQQEQVTKPTILVTNADIPVCCPPKDQAHWNLHPRVYLDIESDGSADCPYCGNHFELQQE
ncbi:zinc-finger domain-containing protein [Aliikangiella marina]|uniref:Zinc-finger domain-containing protein n=1 Tax=Aliikangiella marina TaxID=1712262 RepID=A0A545TCG7_9GAMM|nr:zinc-finger domain-containing protein [Aliikangiella marina]TQV74905.1 zinc-finger domain-containing protein [Aliikangiella marina]